MQRYYKEVKLIDRNRMSIKEFGKRVFGTDELSVYEAVALYNMYKEDGGRTKNLDDFLDIATAKDEREKEFLEYIRKHPEFAKL